MAFCMNCGKELPDGAKFCPVCGTKRDTTPQSTIPQHQPTTNSAVVQPVKNKRKLSKGGIIAIIIGAVVVLTITAWILIWAILDAYHVRQFEQLQAQSHHEELYNYDENIPEHEEPEADDEYNTDANSYNDDLLQDEKTQRILKMNDRAAKIVRDISKDDDYIDGSFNESTVGYTDSNDDGNYELYITYYEENDGKIDICYEVWELSPESQTLLLDGLLYSEVGGNSGSLGLYSVAGEAYVGIVKTTPTGSNYCTKSEFIALEDAQKGRGSAVTLTANVEIASDKATYSINGKSVKKSDYDDRLGDFYTIFSIPDNSKNSSIPMSVDEFLNIYDYQ